MASATVVQKYGGSSVATAQRLRDVAAKVAARHRTGEKVVVVVSAMGKTTDQLIQLAQSVTDRSYKRELDMLLATGEQVSASLLAMALQDLSVDALSLNAFQIGLATTDQFSCARIRDIAPQRLQAELDRRGVVVVTGFQGVTDQGDLTTLGRGGSDTSAVAIAAALGCRCEIYSDVAGVYSCDPRMVPGAKKLDFVTCQEMLELASLGAKVLHSRAVEIADKQDVELYCGSTFSDERGTRIVKNLPEWMEQPVVTGVALAFDQTKVNLRGVPAGVDCYSRIFRALADAMINLDMIAIASGQDDGASLTFSVVSGDMEAVGQALESALEGYQGWSLSIDADVAKVSAVGVGMQSASGVAGRFFSTLERCGIAVLGATTSEIKISVLIPKDQAQSAAAALVEEFGLRE